MKSLTVILTYIATAILFFLILSLVGYMFTNYTWNEVITCGPFQFFYVFFHWTICVFPAIEVNEKLGNPL